MITQSHCFAHAHCRVLICSFSWKSLWPWLRLIFTVYSFCLFLAQFSVTEYRWSKTPCFHLQAKQDRIQTKNLLSKYLILAKETLPIKAPRNDSSSINLNNVIYTFHFLCIEEKVSLQVNQITYLPTPIKKCILITYQQLYQQLYMHYNLVFILAAVPENNTLLMKNLFSS